MARDGVADGEGEIVASGEGEGTSDGEGEGEAEGDGGGLRAARDRSGLIVLTVSSQSS